MPIMPFRLVTTEQAAQFRSITAGRDNVIDPARVEAGPYAGRWAFSEAVMFNSEFADVHDMIRVAAPNATALDTDVAWPPSHEEQ